MHLLFRFWASAQLPHTLENRTLSSQARRQQLIPSLFGDYFFDNLNGGIVPSSDRQRSTFKNFKTLETTLSKGKEFVKKVLAYSVDIAGFAPDLKDENDRPISRPPSAPKGRMKRDNSF